MSLREKLLQIEAIKNWKRNKEKKNFKGSAQYWEDRYKVGDNSGTGSYDHLAEFKAEFLNDFVVKNGVRSVIEFGCGDGNQLTLAKYPSYIGLDIAPTAVQMCNRRFKNDTTKSFYLYNTLAFHDHARVFHCDLSMSLDVLYHLVEKDIFETYLLHLFNAADKYVIIYASDYDQSEEPIHQHENRRKFSDFITKNLKNWKLKEVMKNKYPIETFGMKGSYSDFFIYEKVN